MEAQAETKAQGQALDGTGAPMHCRREAGSQKLSLVALLLCLVGVAVSIELIRIHVLVHTDPAYHSLCAVSEGVNCETVAISPYSVFAGIPVAVWGTLGYLAMGILAGWSLLRARPHPDWPWGGLVVLSIFSVCVSAVLAFLAATRIDSLCLFCMASYAINLALLAVGFVRVRRSGRGVGALLAADARALCSRPWTALGLQLAWLLLVGMLEWRFPRYWQSPGWADLPKLLEGTGSEGAHWIGAEHPVLEIVEFSDYECPHCRAAHKRMRLLVGSNPERVRLVHRHLPLDMACNPNITRPFHLHACRFARAVECAGFQGRFWEMNDAVFAAQDQRKTGDVDPVLLAVRLGMNRSAFQACLDSQVVRDRISADIQQARAKGVRGTPTFFIENRVFLGGIPDSEIEKALRGPLEGGGE